KPFGEKPAKPSKRLINWLKIRRPTEDSPEQRPKWNVKHRDESAEHETDDENGKDTEKEKEYALPSVDLLIESEQLDYDQQMQIARRMAKQLEKAFADYGLNIKVVDIQCGPVIAQFELELERGLRLNKIMNLTDDLAVALRVPTVRIVAPIPGKNTVGIEVPNEMRQLVRLREVIEETPDKLKSKMAVPIFLGKDVAGDPIVIDLAQMPHLLIAGSTGTGKSVCLNSIIVSILMTRAPDECRMIMIDPKMVELGQYESIPHLMHPVVTDMKKAEAILAWAVEKMEQRLQILSRARVRQLSEYNALTVEELYRRVKPETDEEWDETPRSMPYMVIVVDEMGDLMLTAAKEVETHIIRLAAKSRAVGIHLVLATQKPTVDIITGLIKSNLPARIAFTVASQTDSRVILDCNGAEKLLRHGDMLFLKPGTSQVLRGQGTYVSDPEINEIIADIATDSPDYVTELVELPTGDEVLDFGQIDPRDELFNQGVEYILRESMRKANGKASISWLQRKMKIGYQRSARLFDYMEEDGIVGPGQGQQPRDVLISLHEWRRRLAEQGEEFEAKGGGRGTKSEERGTAATKHSPIRPESGIGPINDVDDSMLVEIRSNIRRQDKRPASDFRLEEKIPNTNPESQNPKQVTEIRQQHVVDRSTDTKPGNNVFGVVPVADGDVPFDTDDGEWEYEYEYVYEEVDDLDPDDEDVEEVDIETGDDWET
ncbi:MAG: FtsK/SpoIIIE domain-containing protein, partial [Planctomycetaceae bacterium]|nr:FtsK/SpoIIIE domain-containing protein [Planctomycetaceae bacterium]